ncbi:MAG: disulfide bond formation protein B [Alphaproteobacteria bacterium]|nr:disulfide bond formation protein B [Alphaproteobacteria bacterium]
MQIGGGPLLIALGSAFLLGGALAFQYFGGLAPCQLCVYQRWPHCAVIALALACFVWPRATCWLLFAAGAMAAASAGIGVYHVGVEQGWFAATATCGASGTAADLAELKQQILTAPTARCTDVPWALFGTSLAGFNVLFSAGLGAASWWLAAVLVPADKGTS